MTDTTHTLTIAARDIVAIVVEQPKAVDLPLPAKRPPRRYTTGRNQQFNVKAKAETVDDFYALADELDVPLGELLELAVQALRAAQGVSGPK